MKDLKEFTQEEQDTIVEDMVYIEEDHTVETMKVRQNLRFRTFFAFVATWLFFVLRYFDPNIDFNNVNSPLFLVLNIIVLLLGAIVYFFDNKVRPESYRKEDTYRSYKLLNSLMDIVIIIPMLSLVLTILNMFFFSLSPITGTSMMPNFTDEDAVVFSHINATFDRYDVVIVHREDDDTPYLIKRVVGLPGETVTLSDGLVYINDVLLYESYIDTSTIETLCTNQTMGSFTDKYNCSFTVGEDEYFVLGDNRDGNAVDNGGVSIDSRYFGPITKQEIYGKVVFKFRDYNIIN